MAAAEESEATGLEEGTNDGNNNEGDKRGNEGGKGVS